VRSRSYRLPIPRKNHIKAGAREHSRLEHRRVELVGAACDLRSDELAASIVTPQEVIVPDFKQRKELDNRGVPSALVVTCSKDGKRGVTQVTAQAKELATAYNAGLAAAVLTTLASAAINSGTPWVYQPAVGVLIK